MYEDKMNKTGKHRPDIWKKKDEIIKLYEDISSIQIARIFGCSPTCICKILRKDNIKIKDKGFFLKGKRISQKTEFKKGNPPWNKNKTGKKNLEHSKRMSGEKNPSWQGGKSFEPYGPEFNNKFKRAIRRRDNQICLKCGIHREKLNRALDVHHIDYNKKLTMKENCCTVCRKCNVEVNYNRTHWTKFFQSLLSEKYNYQYSEEGEIVLNLGEVKNEK